MDEGEGAEMRFDAVPAGISVGAMDATNAGAATPAAAPTGRGVPAALLAKASADEMGVPALAKMAVAPTGTAFAFGPLFFGDFPTDFVVVVAIVVIDVVIVVVFVMVIVGCKEDTDDAENPALVNVGIDS